MHEPRHTYTWVTSHIWMSHSYEWVTSRIWIGHMCSARDSHRMMRHVFAWHIRCVAQERVCVCVCDTSVCDKDVSHACAIWKCLCVCVWHIRCVAQVCVCVCVTHPFCTSLCVCATHPTYSCRTYAIHVARVNEITTHIHNQTTTHSTYAYTPQLCTLFLNTKCLYESDMTPAHVRDEYEKDHYTLFYIINLYIIYFIHCLFRVLFILYIMILITANFSYMMDKITASHTLWMRLLHATSWIHAWLMSYIMDEITTHSYKLRIYTFFISYIIHFIERDYYTLLFIS